MLSDLPMMRVNACESLNTVNVINPETAMNPEQSPLVNS